MAKFSVKKPFTVLVAVIAVLVLGFVAYSNMTPDLLPNINMPYAVVVTSYPGATPEKVETVVTKPMEQTMATLENIELISSTSAANLSTVVLEFADGTNMESVTVDILQKITQIEEYWDDSVGTPYVLKLNPSMLPVMVAAVDMEGMETAALSRLFENELSGKLEGVSGVASISASGLVEERVYVDIRPDKVALVNQRIREAVERDLSEAEEELEQAEETVRGGLGEISGGKRQLESGRAALIDGAAAAESALLDKQRELDEGKKELTGQLALAEAGLLEVQENEQRLTGARDGLAGLAAAKAAAETSAAALSALFPKIQAGNPLTAEEAALLAGAGLIDPAQFDPESYDPALAGDVSAAILTLQAQAAGAEAGMNQILDMLDQMGMTEADLPAAIDAVLLSRQQIETGVAQLNLMLSELNKGQLALNAAGVEMNRKMTEGILQIADTTTQMLVGESQLKSALAEIESGIEQLEEAREEALRQADISGMVTMDMISDILTAQNFSMPLGYVSDGESDYLVSVGDLIQSEEELRSLLLFDPGIEGVEPIYLSDVADVSLWGNADDIYTNINGNPGVLLTFSKQSNYATAEVSKNIAEKFRELEAEYPGMRFSALTDQGDYIFIVVDAIMSNLLLGALFAIVILFLFLKDLRPTFVTLCSIPISVLFAIVLMYFSGVTINIISLSGLAVAVGMLVDNSVVVIENIYRLRSKGFSAVQAAVSGTSQVAAAIASSTLTTVCVFLPIVFVEGITKQLFTDLALTVGYSLIASLIVALTLVPAMSATLLKKVSAKPGRLFDRMLSAYARSLRWGLTHRAAVLLTSLALLAVSVVLVMLKGFAFMPGMDMPQLTVELRMPEQSELSETRKASDEAVRRIREIPGVETVGAMLESGGGLFGASGAANTTEVTVYVLVDPDSGRSGQAVSEEIGAALKGLPFEETETSDNSDAMMSFLGDSGISVRVYGGTIAEMQQTARQAAEILSSVEGVASVQDGVGETDPEIRFVVNKEQAMKEGLTTAQVYLELNNALASERRSAALTFDAYDYALVISGGKEKTLTPDYIKNYTFEVTERDGETKTLRIGDITEVIETETATAIERENQRRYLHVSAGIEEGYNVTLVTGEAQAALQALSLPAGMTLEFVGENETIMDAFGELSNMLLLGILLVYLIMVAQFQSLKSPFIVMFTIPLAFTGGLFALLLTGKEMSVVALIGLVMLVGIIVNNGIVLVDYVNQLRMDGRAKIEALIEAGVTRMRPILMTSITTVLGLMMMAVGSGIGSELMQPIAIVCIGGLVYATALTLYVVPVMYDVFHRREEMSMIAEREFEIVDE